MTTTTYDSPTKRGSYSGIYWGIAIAVLVILAFTWTMRPTARDTISPATSQSMTTPTETTTIESNTAMDSLPNSTTTTTTTTDRPATNTNE